VLVNFVMQALRAEPLTIYGDGSQTRAFCHVSDLVRGLQAVMEGDGLDGEVFNLGNAQERTISDLARLVQQACDVDLPIVYEPLPTDDPTRRCPDITLARKELGWEPKIDLREGLERTIDYFAHTMRGQ
jgi:nucleoside-diphosphate-sugar epimerase